MFESSRNESCRIDAQTRKERIAHGIPGKHEREFRKTFDPNAGTQQGSEIEVGNRFQVVDRSYVDDRGYIGNRVDVTVLIDKGMERISPNRYD